MSARRRGHRARWSVVRAALAGVLPLLGIGLEVQARDVPVTRRLDVDGTQIDDGETWSGKVDFDIPALRRGDKLIFDLNLSGNGVTIQDGFVGEDEQIYFRFLADTPPGGARVHLLDYKWTFTGVTGELLVNGITGTGQIRENGQAIIVQGSDILKRRDIDLTNSSFTFVDIKLEVTVPNTLIQWSPNSVEFLVSGDGAGLARANSWAQPSGGSWALASNWVGGVPNGVGAIAEFGPALTSNSVSVALNGPVTVGTLIHNDNSSLSLSNGSGGSLTFDVASGWAGFHVDSTGFPLHSIHATTTLRDDLLIDFSGPAMNEVFYNGNIGEGSPGKSMLVKGGPGRLALNGTNSYTGGLTVDHVLVELNSATAQGAVGSRATAVNGGQIELGFTPTANHRFTVGAGAMISGNSNQLGALSVGGNLELAEGAILGFEVNNSARPAGANPAQLYYGVNGSLSENVTIGSQSGSWRGMIGSAVTNSFHSGKVTVQGNAELGALGGRRLTLQQAIEVAQVGSTIQILPGGEVEIMQPASNTANGWDVFGGLRFGNTTQLSGPVALRDGGGLTVADLEGVTITNPAFSDTAGSRLVSGDVFEGPFGPDLANGGIHFGGGHTYVVNSTFGAAGPISNPNLGVKGPSTVVRFGGTVENNSTPFTVTNFTVQNGGRLNFTDQAAFFMTNAGGQPRPVLAWGENGGGTMEFEAGFVADPLPGAPAGEATPGLESLFVFPGVTLVTNHSQNVAGHVAFDYPVARPTAPGTWRMQGNPHNVSGLVEVFRPMVFHTEAASEFGGTVLIDGGSLTKTGPGQLTIGPAGRLNGTVGSAQVPRSELVVEQGTLQIRSTGNNTIGRLRVSAGGTLNLTGDLKIHPGSTTVSRIDGGFSLGGTAENPAGQLDLTDIGFEISAEVFEQANEDIRRHLQSGYNGGAWDGRGIISSTARANPTLALGYKPFGLAPGAPAEGEPVGGGVPGSGLLVRLTKFGDADLNGVVGFPDLVALAQNYNRSDGGAFWFTGDFNYDGNVTFADLVKLAQNYGSSHPGPIAGAPAEFYGDWARAMASVPEPGGAVVVLWALTGLRRKRREH